MKRSCIGLAALCLFPAPILADGAGSGCGGDAYSFAEVVPARRGLRQHGPIVVMPETLCADLAGSPATRIDSLNIVIDPRPGDERPEPGLPASMRPQPRH
jgi:hypothetical protein